MKECIHFPARKIKLETLSKKLKEENYWKISEASTGIFSQGVCQIGAIWGKIR
jgi:hypothetical protein